MVQKYCTRSTWLRVRRHSRVNTPTVGLVAHIAFLPEPFDHGVKLHFQHMIGDRTGFVHIGNHQVMDLRRKFIDTPFSTYVYDGGYLGLIAPPPSTLR
jgi:hypothetical protein